MIQENKIEIKDNNDENKNYALHWHCLEKNDINNECMGKCYLKEVLNLFGKKYTMKIIRLLLLNEKLRFNEILKEIGGSPKTITKRLRILEDRGLITRKQFNEIPIRVEYSLTDAGKDLEEIFERISLWIKKWMVKPKIQEPI